jgi:hypothetical protein
MLPSHAVEGCRATCGRRSPRNLLADAILRVRVVTVKRDAAGKLKPESLWYSKIDEVISIVAGAPPAFREAKS